MTRPLTEDSQAKQQSNYGYRIRQLERRPAPVTGALVFRAEQWNNLTTTPSGVDMAVVEFDLWSNPDSGVFGTELTAGGDLLKIDLIEPGFIVASLHIIPVQSYDFSVAGLIDDEEGVFVPSGGEWTRKMRAGYGSGMAYLITLARYYPTIDWEEVHGGFEMPAFTCYVGQASGSSRTFQSRIDIAYWPATIGPITEA